MNFNLMQTSDLEDEIAHRTDFLSHQAGVLQTPWERKIADQYTDDLPRLRRVLEARNSRWGFIKKV